MKIETLRKECKKLLIDLNLDRYEGMEALADALGINRRSLGMALTGYRTGPAYKRYLNLLYAHLCEQPGRENEI